MISPKLQTLDRQELHEFFMQAPLPMVILEGPEHRFTLANPQYEKLIGRKVVGKRVREVFSEAEAPGEAEKFIRLLDQVYQTGTPFIGKEVSLNIPDENGKIKNIWIDLGYHPFRGTQGEITGISAIMQDVTEKVLARKVIEESEARYRQAKVQLDLVLENAQLATWQLELKTGIETVLSGALTLFGEEIEPGVHDGIRRRIHPEDAGEATVALREAIRTHTTYSHKYRIIRTDHSIRWVLSRGTPTYDEGGNPVLISGVLMDVSDNIHSKNELKRTTGILDSIMTTTSDMIYVKDRGSHMIYCNPVTLRQVGVSEGDIYGKNDVEFLGPGNGGEEILRTDERIMSSGKGETAEEWVTWYDGTRRLYMSQKEPQRDANGQVIGLVGISRDMTQLKLTQISLEKAIRARDDFLSIASHELKTPLTSLILQNQFRKRQLSKGQMSAFDAKSLENLFDSDLKYFDKINHLIEDMLDITRIRTGKLELRLANVDLCELARESVERLRPQLDKSSVEIQLEICPPAFIYADSFRLEQVITNLLMNAIKYGLGKPIRLEVSPSGSQKVCLRIVDQGIGISEEDQKRIFLPFERAISANEVSGLGLGLSIARSLVKSHKGRITVESTLGEGAKFAIEFPLIEKGSDP